MTARRPELDFQVEPEEPSQETAELWLVFVLVAAELTSQFAKLETHTTDGKQREEEHGQELEVLLWTQSTIPMVVVTNNISVIPQPSADSHLMELKSVLSPLEELDLLEEETKKSSKPRNEGHNFNFCY